MWKEVGRKGWRTVEAQRKKTADKLEMRKEFDCDSCCSCCCSRRQPQWGEELVGSWTWWALWGSKVVLWEMADVVLIADHFVEHL